MTHLETSRINEMLNSQLAVIKELATNMSGYDVEVLEQQIGQMEQAIHDLKEVVEGLPHHHMNRQ